MEPITFLPWDSNLFVMQSQRDGYNHLYLYNTQGQLVRQLTKGAFVVQAFLGFNHKDKSVIIVSNEVSPIQRNLYAVQVKNGKRTRLDNGRGSHHATLSATGQWLYDRYSEPSVPRNIDVVNTSNSHSYRLLTADDPWEDYQQPAPVVGRALHRGLRH